MKHYACTQVTTQMSANIILYFTWPVYRQLMPKPDRKEGREERKRKEWKEEFLICYITLTSGVKLLPEM